MVAYPDHIRFAFRTERLVFRALEDNDADKNFVFELNNDPVCTAMSSMTVLRPVATSTYQKFANFANDCQLLSIACLPPLANDAEGKELAETTPRVSPRDVTIAQVKDTTPIGFVCVMGETSRHRRGTLGIGILEPFTGKGYGREMINWALDWGFGSANLHRIGLETWGNNANALKLYRSLGFVEEGVEREAVVFDRKFVDVIRFGMLEGEWEKLRGITS
ncbi:acyl-CoA N-acyltransferase [Coniochaeta sp. 2T2.1]|nr:acyl-CoA N-acyltransferase [Coniochaeta sp. 2T2.1]